MKKMNFEQMENVQGGIEWCAVGRGVTGVGAALLAVGVPFSCGLAGAAYGAIAITTALYC